MKHLSKHAVGATLAALFVASLMFFAPFQGFAQRLGERDGEVGDLPEAWLDSIATYLEVMGATIDEFGYRMQAINQGLKKGMGKSQEEEKIAVETGYWPLYRYDPRLEAEGKNPFQLDSKEPAGNFQEFLMGEVRYASLKQSFPEEAARLHAQLESEYMERYQTYKKLAEG